MMIVFIIGSYLSVYHTKLFAQSKMLWLITSIFLIQFLATILMQEVLNWSYLSIPITLGPMLLSMLLDASIAFVGTIAISLVLGAAGGNNFFLALMVFVVGTIALFSVQKIRNRGQMFRAILFILLGYALVNFSYGFIHYESFRQMLQNFVFYLLPNAILVPTAVFLLIGLFEKFFDVTTDITLLELSDLNHPLLKRLSVEAPGTFHHSIIVGNLAEAAAKEISANSLLARVGCYYHDIGKMQLSEYFVENQPGTASKHESLTPSMSSLILAKHVRAGLELGDQYGLPIAVKKFIPEHHGTSIMSYFYHKALETMDPKDINENDFRYPGPKPQSKETAIAMLADTVEAASRTLPNPNLQRINSLVENLIEKRFQEGELDECDVTLRELNKIKGAFVRILMGIHHIRIEYPSEERTREKNRKTVDLKDHNEEIEHNPKGDKKDQISSDSTDSGLKTTKKDSDSPTGFSQSEHGKKEDKN
jgi:putative nucleotidyltransferase with HDIG domain